MFALNQWYVAGFGWEFDSSPLVARTLLGKPVVLFRTPDGKVAALEDRCCHRSLPLSCGTVEDRGLRCGYHGLLFAANGACLEIPGQEKIPSKCKVHSYQLVEKDQILWIWFGDADHPTSLQAPPDYPWHSDARYEFRGDIYHYDAPYQLIHDNLLDLSHLGYVHLRTIGGDPSTHMEAEMKVESEGNVVRVVRYMRNSKPPKTYAEAWPFVGNIDRWQEIEFDVSHLRIWTGAVDADTESLDDAERGGFHMRGLHGVTPETETTTHYFWTMSTNRPPNGNSNMTQVFEQTALTFEEDKVVIEAQYGNLQRFGAGPQVDIHVDVGANRARRIIASLTNPKSSSAATAA
ncbi:aromatic ring-hydroxylating dioxygenase subunit alpha [Burkholderia vietnamiensis]|uniref:aromatic ring-hydroxylating dioxygenase subunit alpha n=1 Tax=Burkholderia vietnamiensis TaxID=60552 RepID=UPI00264D30BA|nr:aromatic ring-hydroxylating dioxygenase subunit alpha [Burkholderia vietnamiensis]MDN8037060.1 aromatic ring-hydroxylating dioxygenase subunit alpha [Burkholderia vietnamiensis]